MKTEHIHEASKRLKQTIKVLINKPKFQSTIVRLREKWNIPKDGIKDQEKLDLWYRDLDIKTQNYFDEVWPAKKQEIILAKENGDFANSRKIQDDFNRNVPRNAFLNDTKVLIREQELSPRWLDGIKRYLLLNDPENMGIFVGPIISKNIDMEFGSETISIEIDATTTLRDIKAIWPEVKVMQSSLSYSKRKKFQPLRKFDRNKKAYDLHMQGKKYSEIAVILSKGKNFVGEEDVAKMIERYKKMVDIN